MQTLVAGRGPGESSWLSWGRPALGAVTPLTDPAPGDRLPVSPLGRCCLICWESNEKWGDSGKPFNSILGLQGLLIGGEGDPVDS